MMMMMVLGAAAAPTLMEVQRAVVMEGRRFALSPAPLGWSSVVVVGFATVKTLMVMAAQSGASPQPALVERTV